MRSRLVCLLCCLALTGSGAEAQSFHDSISVVEVEIPVQVLRDGDPVEGLERKHFEVRVDGEPVEVVGFDVRRYESRTAVASKPGDGPATTRERTRYVLVFFDLVFSEPRRISRALDGVRTMVDEQLAAGDRVALAFLTENGVRMPIGFTPDREEIRLGLDLVEGFLDRRDTKIQRAVSRLSQKTRAEREESPIAFLSQRFGTAAALGLNQGLTGLTFDGAGIGLVRAGDRDDSEGIDPVLASVAASDPEEIGASLAQGVTLSRIRTLALEVGRLASLLQELPGPKDLLFLSEGFPSGILESHVSQDRAQTLGFLQGMLESLIRGGWTLHGVDVEGIPTSTAKGFDAHALYYMANETGGQILENFNRVEQATERYLHRTEITYVLTIRAKGVPVDGARHEIDVLLRGGAPRGRVHHRPAFYAPRPDRSLTELERELELIQRLLGSEEENRLAVRSRAGQAHSGSASGDVHFALAVPPEPLVEDARAGVVPLDVRIFALDERGGALGWWSRRLTLDLRKVGHRVEAGGLHLVGSLTTPTPAARLRVLIRIPGRSPITLLTVEVDDSWSSPDWPWDSGLTLRTG